MTVRAAGYAGPDVADRRRSRSKVGSRDLVLPVVVGVVAGFLGGGEGDGGQGEFLDG